MTPAMDAYTVAMPWYERDDFTRILALAADKEQMPTSYDVWHQNATRVVENWLSQGRALQIVTVHSERFLSWIEKHDLPNTADSRLRYVMCLTTSDGADEALH